MASQRSVLNDDFTKISSGGVRLQVMPSGEILIGITSNGSAPDEEDCWIISDTFEYAGNDDVYAKSRFGNDVAVVTL